MARVIDVLAVPDLEFLIKAADELDEILSNIAYNGKSKDIEFIKKSQQHMKNRYGKKLEFFRPMYSETGLGKAISCIVDAYDGLQDLLDHDIEEEAKEILGEYLLWFYHDEL